MISDSCTPLPPLTASPISVRIYLGKCILRGLIDTGAQASVLSSSSAERLNLDSLPLTIEDPKLLTASGSSLQTIATVIVHIGNRPHRFYVCEIPRHDLIIGTNVLSHFLPLIITRTHVFLAGPRPIMRFTRILSERASDGTFLDYNTELDDLEIVSEPVIEEDSSLINSLERLTLRTAQMNSVESDELLGAGLEENPIPVYTACRPEAEITAEREFVRQKLIDVVRKSALPERLFADAEKLLLEFQHLFVQDLTVGAAAKTPPHKIELIPGAPLPPPVRTAGVPPHLVPLFYETVERMQKAGILVKLENPVVVCRAFFVPQKGTHRLVVNYRPLNAITQRSQLSLPAMRDIFANLHHFRFCSKIDLRSAYHQIPLHPDSIPLTGFLSPDGSVYGHTAIPLGLTNAPPSFQATMSHVFRGMIFRNIVVVVDDLLPLLA